MVTDTIDYIKFEDAFDYFNNNSRDFEENNLGLIKEYKVNGYRVMLGMATSTTNSFYPDVCVFVEGVDEPVRIKTAYNKPMCITALAGFNAEITDEKENFINVLIDEGKIDDGYVDETNEEYYEDILDGAVSDFYLTLADEAFDSASQEILSNFSVDIGKAIIRIFALYGLEIDCPLDLDEDDDNIDEEDEIDEDE